MWKVLNQLPHMIFYFIDLLILMQLFVQFSHYISICAIVKHDLYDTLQQRRIALRANISTRCQHSVSQLDINFSYNISTANDCADSRTELSILQFY